MEGMQRMDTADERLALGLGWFSIALGVAEVTSPRAVARWSGIRTDESTASVVRSLGAREIGHGLAILAQPDRARWLWSRVAVRYGCRTVFLLEDDDPLALAAELRLHRDLSVLKLTPAHLDMLSRQLTPVDLRGLVRCVVVGGEALHGRHVRWWQEADPTTLFVNEYGPTEAVVGCCAFDVPAPGEGYMNTQEPRPHS